MRGARICWTLVVLCASSTAAMGCSNDDVGVGYCVVTAASAQARDDGSKPGELVQADSGCLEDEVLICGSYNTRDQFVSDDCADGVGAPTDD